MQFTIINDSTIDIEISNTVNVKCVSALPKRFTEYARLLNRIACTQDASPATLDPTMQHS